MTLEQRTAVVLVLVNVIAWVWMLGEWAWKRHRRKPEILPPPNRSARRLHLEEWEDIQ
jgi:hypothetical protein